MVALNTAYAPTKNLERPQNRVGDFFYETADRIGTNRLPARNYTVENGPTVTIIVSGRPSFISRDPIGLSGGDVNFYAYVGNNPINYVDPDGLIPTEGGSGDVYRSDPFGHGSHPDGRPVDPHLDRIDRNGNKYRYNPDGSGRNNAPKVPKKDTPAFNRELNKLNRSIRNAGPPSSRSGGGSFRGGNLLFMFQGPLSTLNRAKEKYEQEQLEQRMREHENYCEKLGGILT